jgi:hypothetical protein
MLRLQEVAASIFIPDMHTSKTWTAGNQAIGTKFVGGEFR